MKSKVPQPTEFQLCEIFVLQFEYMIKCKQFNKSMYLIHIANEQGNNKISFTKRLKRIGLKKGVADYCILIEGGRVAFIEFKRNGKSPISDEQSNFGDLCGFLGIPYLLTWQVDEAISWIKTL